MVNFFIIIFYNVGFVSQILILLKDIFSCLKEKKIFFQNKEDVIYCFDLLLYI